MAEKPPEYSLGTELSSAYAKTQPQNQPKRRNPPYSVSFIQNTLTAAEDHPEILPRSFNAPRFKRDVELFTQLTEIGTLIVLLASDAGQPIQAGWITRAHSAR
uniref:Uncharacterized protein n=1 Tax=Candidatus Kentrum sp. LPFa TaxID=2126335 RepID=A0A450W372_9GAMM|nr:MAG: hypothetical protein BECKLPF1236A_GA0070988_1005218 [Candidatus Kentron sp. LPFa]VFK29950.1 MAG: hypothetical protein BECKLPF1236C_GA0070990_100994 [Candidatus Kentron sp. LPFa]